MNKRQTLAVLLEAIIKQIQVIERFGAHQAMIEACETITGVMVEQGELFCMAEHSQEKELKEWAMDKGTNGRIYSGHLTAIRDALRLCKLVTELVDQVNGFIEDGGEEYIKELQK